MRASYVDRTDIITVLNPEKHVLFLPGVLARAPEQINPILEPFRLKGYAVSTIDYTEPLSVAGVVDEVASIIIKNLRAEQKTILFGASFGGMVTAEVIARLRLLGTVTSENILDTVVKQPLVTNDLSNLFHDKRRKQILSINSLQHFLEVVIADSPADGKDLAPVPAWALSSVKWFTNHVTPDTDANSGYGAWLLKPRSVNLPKRAESENMSDAEFEAMCAEARKNLSEQSFTLYYDQLKWMLHAQTSCWALDDVSSVYIACTSKNVTVRQPQAVEKWRPYVTIKEIATPHCAFLQQKKMWQDLLSLTLTELDSAPPVK